MTEALEATVAGLATIVLASPLAWAEAIAGARAGELELVVTTPALEPGWYPVSIVAPCPACEGNIVADPCQLCADVGPLTLGVGAARVVEVEALELGWRAVIDTVLTTAADPPGWDRRN